MLRTAQRGTASPSSCICARRLISSRIPVGSTSGSGNNVTQWTPETGLKLYLRTFAVYTKTVGPIDSDEVLEVLHFHQVMRSSLFGTFRNPPDPKFRLRAPTLRVKIVIKQATGYYSYRSTPPTTPAPYPANASGSTSQLAISSCPIRDAGQPKL